jgi:hypothetical protein
MITLHLLIFAHIYLIVESDATSLRRSSGAGLERRGPGQVGLHGTADRRRPRDGQTPYGQSPEDRGHSGTYLSQELIHVSQ